MLLDNNWLADQGWFMETSQWIIDNKLRLLENGMDIRLVNDAIASRLAEIRFDDIMHFAYDREKDSQAVFDGIQLLKKKGINIRRRVSFYVYVDSPKQLESSLARCQQLKEWGTNPFVMYNVDKSRPQEIRNLQRWANRKALFWSKDFSQYKKAEKLGGGKE
jgi:hypothetical protein